MNQTLNHGNSGALYPPNEGASSLLPFNETFRQNMRTAHEKVRKMTKVAAKTEKIVL